MRVRTATFRDRNKTAIQAAFSYHFTPSLPTHELVQNFVTRAIKILRSYNINNYSAVDIFVLKIIIKKVSGKKVISLN